MEEPTAGDDRFFTRRALLVDVHEESTGAGTLPAEATVGRVSLRVDDLGSVLPFYREAIGCRVQREGHTARLCAADGRELVVFEEAPDAPPRPRSAAGLFHVAIRLPDRASLGDALARIRDAGVPLSGASDHLVSEALYLQDPAGNGLELYRDRPRAEWTRLDDGGVEMDTLPLPLDELAEAGDGAARDELPDGTDVGHVHLEVTDLAAASEFYVDGLGFSTTSRYVDGAQFVAAGGYHHHVGLNTWNRRTEPVGDHQGLDGFEVVLPDDRSRRAVVDRLAEASHDVDESAGVPVVSDPDGIGVRFPVRAGAD